MVDKAAIIAALLSTTAISLAPNIILFLSPNFASSNQNKSNPLLQIGQALAAGALIGDVFLHTLPHMMVDSCAGGGGHDGHDGHDVAETLGLSILFGFCAFYAFDCLVRAFGEGDGHTHGSAGTENVSSDTKIFSPTVILNLASDAMHNFTDGLAIGASFAVSAMALHDDHHDHHHDHGHDHQDDSSIHYDDHHGDDCCKKTLMKNVITLLKSRGGLATLAIFCHEIPHELGDFAVLVSAGMSKRQAIMAQFSTAIAAFCGTIVGLLMVQHVQEFVGFDILVPFTAGGFLYVAAVGILPSLLMEDDDDHHPHDSNEKEQKQKKTMNKLYQLMAFMVGIAFMYMVALLEEHDHSHGEGGGHSHGHHHHAHPVVDTLVDVHDHHGHHDHHDDHEPCCDHDHDHHHHEL